MQQHFSMLSFNNAVHDVRRMYATCYISPPAKLKTFLVGHGGDHGEWKKAYWIMS